MKVSILTATFNCSSLIEDLIGAILSIEYDDIEWVVVDGGSTDDTYEKVLSSGVKNIVSMSEPDCGIYHALNKAVEMASGEYYLVLGADDLVFPDAVSKFVDIVTRTECDIVASYVCCGDKVLKANPSSSLVTRGGNRYVASHAVGTFIRRSIHDRCGPYKYNYPNCADMYFIIDAIKNHGFTIYNADFVSGIFCDAGVSSVNRVTSTSDAFRIFVDLGGGYWKALFVYVFRLMKIGFCISR